MGNIFPKDSGYSKIEIILANLKEGIQILLFTNQPLVPIRCGGFESPEVIFCVAAAFLGTDTTTKTVPPRRMDYTACSSQGLDREVRRRMGVAPTLPTLAGHDRSDTLDTVCL